MLKLFIFLPYALCALDVMVPTEKWQKRKLGNGTSLKYQPGCRALVQHKALKKNIDWFSKDVRCYDYLAAQNIYFISGYVASNEDGAGYMETVLTVVEGRIKPLWASDPTPDIGEYNIFYAPFSEKNGFSIAWLPYEDGTSYEIRYREGMKFYNLVTFEFLRSDGGDIEDSIETTDLNLLKHLMFKIDTEKKIEITINPKINLAMYLEANNPALTKKIVLEPCPTKRGKIRYCLKVP